MHGLSHAEAKLLLHMETLPPDRYVSSTTLCQDLKGNTHVSPAERGGTLRLLARLEERGLIQSGPSPGQRWRGTTITQLGRSQALIERVMPVGRKLWKKAVRKPPYKAMAEARTVFRNRVVHDFGAIEVLKPGGNNGKVGDEVFKGHFRGYRIYTLTLEERATCPRSCAQWGSCYGNNMSHARRHVHGPELEKRLQQEVGALMVRHPKGVLIRLHVLGDFYSAHYVRMWGALLDKYPKLAVFGYTARNDHIRSFIERVSDKVGWHRFAIRYSTQEPADTRCATVYEHGAPVPSVAFACPEQLDKVDTCGHCAACWQGEKTVAFLKH